jgi:glycosyltransferase involved in cell wall biosynthesis
MAPFFIKHYSKFCEKLIIYDNESSDRTPEIIKACPQAEIRTWSSAGKINDQMYLDIKNNAYRESRGQADWVIVCDMDEFIHHENLVAKLRCYRRFGINYPKIKGFEMMPEQPLQSDDDLPHVHKMGVRFKNLDKRILFSPDLDIEYFPGAHNAKIPNGSRQSLFSDIKLLHYKMISLEQYVSRAELMGRRLSDINKEKGWGSHYTWSREKLTENYKEFFDRRKKVV